MKIRNYGVFIAATNALIYLYVALFLPDFNFKLSKFEFFFIDLFFILLVYFLSTKYVYSINFLDDEIKFKYPTRIKRRIIVIKKNKIEKVVYNRINAYASSDELYVYSDNRKFIVFVILNKKKKLFLEEYFKDFELYIRKDKN